MGVRSDTIPEVSAIDELIGHTETGGVKSLGAIPFASLSAQIDAQRGPDYSTLVELQADLNWPAGSEGRVWGDTTENNGVYQKSGSAGSGAWTKLGPLPETDLSRSLRVPVGESITEFPDAATRAGTVPIFDADGNPTAGPTAADIADAQVAATAAVQAASDASDAKDIAVAAAAAAASDAVNIAFSPAGGIAADNVQTALEELDAEKANVADLGGGVPVGFSGIWMSDLPPSADYIVVKSATQVFSRATYSELFDHYAPERTVVINSGSAIVSGIGSDNGFAAGMEVEGAQIPVGTTILSVDGPSQVTLSANATANGTTCRVFRWGNGDGATTCPFPPFEGNYFRFGDPSQALNPDAAGAMGVTMLDALQDHIHGQNMSSNASGSRPEVTDEDTGIPNVDTGFRITGNNASSTEVFQIATDGPATEAGARVSTETRPKTIVGFILVRVTNGVDDPTPLQATQVIQDTADALSKANANETKIGSVAILQHQQPSGTNGGAATSGSRQLYPINTEVEDPNGIASISSNQFTITTKCKAVYRAFFYNTHRTNLFIRNVTDGVDAGVGVSQFIRSGTLSSGMVSGTCFLEPGKTYQMEYECEITKSSDGLGIQTSFGSVEVFGEITLEAI